MRIVNACIWVSEIRESKLAIHGNVEAIKKSKFKKAVQKPEILKSRHVNEIAAIFKRLYLRFRCPKCQMSYCW